MQPERHGISAQEWNDYVEGRAAAGLCDRIEAHMLGCWSCWELYEQLARATQALRAEGEQARVALPLTDADLRAGLQNVLARVAEAEASEHSQIRARIKQRIDALAAVLAPMCGARTADKALRAAAQDSPARSLERMTEDNWTPFLANLRSIATVMCGETGAHLVWESGQ